MSTSLLYHAFGTRGYRYVRTAYTEGQVIFTIRQEPKTVRCPACGADLRVMVPKLIDLTDRELDLEREHLDLLGALLAAGDDAEAHPKPRWGVHTPTMLDLELAPVRIGRFPSPDDLLPTDIATRRGRRRR